MPGGRQAHCYWFWAQYVPVIAAYKYASAQRLFFIALALCFLPIFKNIMKKFSIAFGLLSLFFFVTSVLLLPVFSNAETTFLLSFGSAEIKMTSGKNLFLGGLFLALAAWCFWEHKNAQKKKKGDSSN